MIRFLYSTREKHPTFRVDLTELISRGLGRVGYAIDWHMQSMAASAGKIEQPDTTERVFVGRSFGSGGILVKFMYHFAGVLHDIALYWIVRRGQYDFVQVRDKPFAALVGLVAARHSGARFFYWMSFPYPEADVSRASDPSLGYPKIMRAFYWVRGSLAGWMLYRIVLVRADHVFVQSPQMLADVAERGIARIRMTAVPMGVNLDVILDPELRATDDPRLLGKNPLVYIGTMVRVRRIDFLVDMLGIVRRDEPDATLVLVGDAPDTDMNLLVEVARRQGLTGSVIFTGFVPMERAWGYAKAAKVCFSPFRPDPILNSTSPTKIIEYLALGKPVVANKHPDQSDVLRESGAGYAVDYTPEAFAEATIRLLRDPEKAAEMGRRGLGYVRKCRSYSVLAAQLDEKYRRLLAEFDHACTPERRS